MKTKAIAVLRIVKAPNTWYCGCGKRIEAGEGCAKIGKQIICMECLEKAK